MNSVLFNFFFLSSNVQQTDVMTGIDSQEEE